MGLFIATVVVFGLVVPISPLDTIDTACSRGDRVLLKAFVAFGEQKGMIFAQEPSACNFWRLLTLFVDLVVVYRLISAFTHQGRASHFVRETFRQRKVETDPRLIQHYVAEAEQFCVEWTRSEPAPTGLYARGGALYQRNEPLPQELLKPSAHVDFEALNKLESESDYYIARYQDSQAQEVNQKFTPDAPKL